MQQLHRAAAQRGRLDPVYQDLSDHWTLVLQRLYPVWALIGPGLSDPGHIEIHSRTVYLDSDALLGSRAAIAAGKLERRAILRCFGVALHETMHAKHTKRWAIEHDIALSESDDPADRQLAVDRRLLEEPRMEAHGVREFPPDSLRGRFVRRALQAAIADVILPAFTGHVLELAAACRPLTRDLAARATVYLRARTQYGIVDPADLTGLGELWLAVLGEHDLRALDDLYGGSCGSPMASSSGSTRRPASTGESSASPTRHRAPAEPARPEDPAKAGGRPIPTKVTAPTPATGREQSRSQMRSSGRSRPPAPASSRSSTRTSTSGRCSSGPPAKARSAAGSVGGGGPGCRPGGFPTAASTGRRTPTRCSTHAGTPIGCARRSRRGRGRSTSAHRAGGSTAARTPAAVPNGPPDARSRRIRGWSPGRWRAPIQEPHVGLIIDTSGSMGGYEYALGPIAWILTDGLRQIGGRCATALFGNAAALLSDGSRPIALVPGIRTGGGTAFAGDAIELVSDQLEMTNPRRPRFVYVLSDGGWADTRAGVERIRGLAQLGVPTIHLSIGIAPLSVECDRITVITDPAQALDHIAADTVAALAARQRRPRSR